MAHIIPDCKSKKEFKERVKNGEDFIVIGGLFLAEREMNGKEYIEAPADYHRWYAEIELKDGKIISVK